jgi:uncharacterized protein YndB with AHSA1/START domain
MPPITTTIEVGRPAEEVFPYVTNPSRFAEWQHGSWVVTWTAMGRLWWGIGA